MDNPDEPQQFITESVREILRSNELLYDQLQRVNIDLDRQIKVDSGNSTVVKTGLRERVA